MLLALLKSKIHEARVTAASIKYEGSLTIDEELMQKVGLLPYERILVGNMANGNRFETYVIKGVHGARQIQLNGATAHLGKIGDHLTIMSYGQFTPEEAAMHQPRIITVGEGNEPLA